MKEIVWKAPSSIYKELNSIVGDINKLVEGRKSKSLHNLFTSNKKLADELNKKLSPLVKRASELFIDYSIDILVRQSCKLLDNRLKSWKKEFGINVRLESPNRKPVYQVIQENLYEAEESASFIRDQLDKKIKEMQKWKENLDKVATVNKNNLEKVSKLFEDTQNKNSVIMKYISEFTIIKKENQQYLLTEERKPVEELKKCSKEWPQKFEQFTKNANTFLSRAEQYDVAEIKSDMKIKISSYQKQVEKNISEMNISISECAKLCNGKLPWNEIQKTSSELVRKATTVTFDGKSADVENMDKNISNTIDKEYNALCYLKNSVDEGYTKLTELYNRVQSLIPTLGQLQSSLKTRIYCKGIFVFDKNSSPKDKSKLQDVFDIVYNKNDIVKPNYIPYIIGHADWVLVDGNLKEVKVTGINTPYKEKADLQKDLRKIYK